jgi:hypothetical protein
MAGKITLLLTELFKELLLLVKKLEFIFEIFWYISLKKKKKKFILLK